MDEYNKMLSLLREHHGPEKVIRHVYPFDEEECRLMVSVLRRSGYEWLADKMDAYIGAQNQAHDERHRALTELGWELRQP